LIKLRVQRSYLLKSLINDHGFNTIRLIKSSIETVSEEKARACVRNSGRDTIENYSQNPHKTFKNSKNLRV